MIKNEYGILIDFDIAVSLMDDDIRERVHYELAPCTDQEFFDRYCRYHIEKFGDDFQPAQRNPVF